MTDHILKRKHLTKRQGEALTGRKVPVTIEAEGGLHYIRGNSAPYFSLTANVYRKGFPDQDYMGGCCHDVLLKHWPTLADLAALHLSDIDGQPSSAEANGWYWLAGVLGGMGEQYHGGNRETYGEPKDCLGIFARHCRITEAEAQAIADKVQCEASLDRDAAVAAVAPSLRPMLAAQLAENTPRKTWAAICEAMRPRWKAEAEACIAKHRLRLFGDHWDGAEAWRAAHPPKHQDPADVEPAEDGVAALIAAKGLTFTAEPALGRPNAGDWPKGSRHFAYTVKGGRVTLSGFYSVGPGIVDSWVKEARPMVFGMAAQRADFLKGKRTAWAEEYAMKAGEKYRPTIADVLHSLASDAQSVMGSPLFEDWASDLGYDTDSIKAKKIWEACTEIRHKLESLLGREEFEQLTA